MRISWIKLIKQSWSKADTIAAIGAATAILVTLLNYGLWKEARNAVAAANLQAEFAKKMYEAELRPRITPTGAKLRGEILPGEPLQILITYRNAGREPAIISNEQQQYAVTKFAKTVTGRARDIPPFQNDTCPPPIKGQQGLVVYPDLSKDYTSLLEVPAGYWQADIVEGTSLLYVAGCLTYQHLEKSYRSAYCFYLKPEVTRGELNWDFLFCGNGNFAD